MEEPRVFLIFDKVTPQLRGCLTALLIIAGFLFQLHFKNIYIGMPFIIACLILNLMKGVSVKKIATGTLTWQEVTPAKIDQVLEHCNKLKKFRSKDTGCFLCFLAFFLFFGISFLKAISLPFGLLATIVNAIILFAGLVLSGRKSAWIPSDLDIKAEVVKRISNAPIIKNDPSLQAMPYLEIGKTGDGTLPNDARVLIKFKDAPSEFIGLQGQISINNVKAKAYPYFYVVVIAKHELNMLEKAGHASIPTLAVEPKRNEDVDVIVVRQQTTKTSGYHTDEGVQDYILANGLKLAKSLFSKGA